jgi:hypothetical protein
MFFVQKSFDIEKKFFNIDVRNVAASGGRIRAVLGRPRGASPLVTAMPAIISATKILKTKWSRKFMLNLF